MNWADIISLINNGNWEQARKEINLSKNIIPYDDTAAIAEASVYLHENDEASAYRCIAAGLKYNCRNYELYVMLGNYYRTRNICQAYLCYENAEFYCGQPEDKVYIRQCMAEIMCQSEGALPSPVSIVIVSYNNMEMMKNCILSIHNTTPTSSYELIVTDNASTDGIREWMELQSNITLIKNSQNKGFSYACNQGVKAAKPDNDIFFLNNDTLIPPNAIFWLRMGLYENEKVGAVGSTSNYVGNGQSLTETYSSVQEYWEYGEKHNIPCGNPYEKKVWLSGFALLIKRRALDEIGLFDLRYGRGFFEDDDIGIRLRYAGYHLLLCHNSFIFHYGSQSFNKDIHASQKQMFDNRQIFQKKWGFDIERYSYPQTAVLGLIAEAKEAPIRVLEIGCGTGMLLSQIKYLWPNSIVMGIEALEKVALLGKDYLGVTWGNAETMEFPYEKNYFDYIIWSDVLGTFYSPEKVIVRLKPYLKKEGRMLFGIFNAAHLSVLASLLKGTFFSSEINLPNKDYIRFFAANDIVRIMEQCGLIIEDFQGIRKDDLLVALPQELRDALCHAASENSELLHIFYYFTKTKIS